MKKKILLPILGSFLLLFAACNQEPEYSINGTIVGEAEGEKIYLKLNDNLRPGDAIDSAVIKNGTFNFKGNVKLTDLYFITSSKGNGSVAIFLDNQPTSVSFDITNPKNSYASNSALNDLLKKYNAGKQNALDEMATIRKKEKDAKESESLTPELQAVINKEYEDATERHTNFQIDFMNQNDSSLVSAYVLRSAVNTLPVSKSEELLQKLEQKIGKTDLLESSKEQIKIIKRVDIGQMFVDLKLPSPDGNLLAISDYAGKGKYVLIDFWAAWCPPCRRDMPHIVKIYEKYKNKDFEIIGVSFDRNKEEWLKGLEELGMTWPQISDLKYWQSEGAKIYNVRSIPHTIFLDKEGKIIAKNLTPDKLEAKLKEVLAQ